MKLPVSGRSLFSSGECFKAPHPTTLLFACAGLPGLYEFGPKIMAANNRFTAGPTSYASLLFLRSIYTSSLFPFFQFPKFLLFQSSPAQSGDRQFCISFHEHRSSGSPSSRSKTYGPTALLKTGFRPTRRFFIHIFTYASIQFLIIIRRLR